ncbi:DUF6634 family protein [Paradevosia shaoguanensis]|uniref:Uncharacterized protein n=1 Tax=Paradevosia shaoguanensis TaxID=1335043 RepID=A0AA41QMH0_9HYPH|nr:DUF6634 family protein [Paradevosia shaoguanensis]MCF1742051.1 hypothetical protein [Paradevosia shaoguanensis]MCI0126534.1 hypothetical protein [Paradevosia shaoguanensis]
MSLLTRDTVLAGLRAARRIQQGHLPTQAELAAAPVLSNWVLAEEPGNLFRLAGMVSGHPLLADGWCTTSIVLVMDPDRNWARTVSRLYRLEKPLLRNAGGT